MTLLVKLDFPEAKFSLYFMGYEDPKDVPTDKVERQRWAMSRKATLELTQYVIILLKIFLILGSSCTKSSLKIAILEK